MNEIHIKFKPFVIGTILIFVLMFYFAARSPECPISSATVIAPDASYHEQQMPQTKRSSEQFTIYAITPTYARPVQKAELTRCVEVK